MAGPKKGIDFKKLVELLFKEFYVWELETIRAIAENPDFNAPYNRIMDWRNYVLHDRDRTKKNIDAWLAKPLEERIAEVAHAVYEASQEEWD